MGRFVPFSTAPKVERAILVGVDCGKSDWSLEESTPTRIARSTLGAVENGTNRPIDSPS